MRRLALILPFLTSLAFAQPARFTTSEPLEKAVVKGIRAIYKDSRGFMWFGTHNGLARFDGTNVVLLRHIQGDSTSIPDNTVNSIAEDSQKQLWVATHSGVAKINPYSFKCSLFTMLNHLIHSDFDNRVFIDSQGKIWLINSNGLEKFNKQKNSFEVVWSDVVNDQVTTRYTTSIAEFDRDHLVLGTLHDIVIVEKNTYKFHRPPIKLNGKLAFFPVGALYVDAQKNIWIGGWAAGFIKYNSATGNSESWLWEKNDKANNGNIVNAIVPDKKSNGKILWIGTYNSLIRFDTEFPDLNHAKIYKKEKDNAYSVQEGVGKIYIDESGLMWLGGEVVQQLNTSNSFFNSAELPIKGNLQDIQSVIWNGAKHYFVSSWYSDTGLIILDSNFHLEKKVKGLYEDQNISGVAVDKLQRIWISTLAGVYVLNNKLQVVHRLDKSKSGVDTLSRNKTSGILIHHDTVWVLCYNKGIDLFDLNFKKLKSFPAQTSGLKEGLFWKIIADRRDNIWIAGNAFLYKFDKGKSEFDKFSFTSEGAGYGPHDLAERPDGSLLLASEKGLINYHPISGKHNYITSPLLKREENTVSVTTDENGNAWYLTNEHLVFHDFTKKQFSLFGKEDGIEPAKANVVRNLSGKLFMPAEGQLISFDESLGSIRVDPPKIFITQVQVNDSLVVNNEPVNSMDLNYNQNRIEFEFAGVNYQKTEQNQFAYFLEGADKNWIYTNRNFVSYPNLTPGEYSFHVKAANYAGAWSGEEVVKILIHPPFWKTWWFIGISIIVFGTLLILMIRYIAQRNLRERILLLEKEQAVEKERTRIARDMHDDLGSGLTKIAILSEVAKKQLETPQKAINQLENISASSRDLVDSLQDIIWVLNPKNDSLDSLAIYIREYALKYFDPMNIRVKFLFPAQIPGIKLSEEIRRNIFLVVKETFSNIAKHANCNEVIVSLDTSNDSFQLKITDNGKGFDKSKVRTFANGLQNMQNRMEQAGGRFDVDASPGKGTQTTLAIFN